MKHNWRITTILITMFLVTQLIGLLVIYAYTPQIEQIEINGTIRNITINPLPYGLETPETTESTSLFSLILAFAIAIGLIFLLTKFKAATFLRIWFFVVAVLVLSVSFVAFEILVPWEIPYKIAMLLPVLIAIPLAYLKVFKGNILAHNFTELLIYPGIAAVFVPILGLWSIMILLILISIYDMWAVWHSGIMQKMANFQMKEMKVFGGFFVPYLNKSQRAKLKKLREQNKNSSSKTKKKSVSMKVNLAILGGGDVVFPIITAGIIFRLWGLIPALSVVLFGTLALFGLFTISKKGKFYPAMPFISSGLFIGILVGYLLYLYV
jgi:presenilin-like A22 family membrane protease